jgi:hypothetical protein
MPYTTTQVKRILAGRMLPNGHTLTTSQAVCESVLRARLIRFENRAIKNMDAAFKRAWAGMSGVGATAADRLNMDGKLTVLNGGLAWRDTVTTVIAQQADGLYTQLRDDAMQRAILAYQGAYLGKAWGLTASRKPDYAPITPNMPTRAVIESRIRREWALRYGYAWDDSFRRPFSEFATKAHHALNTAVTQQETPSAGMRRVKTLMGVSTYKQLYFQAQLNIRQLILVGASLGELQLYVEYGGGRVSEAVAGFGAVMGILTQGDGRVCPTCLAASKRIWVVNSMSSIVGAALTLPIPPLHHACRCQVYVFPLPEELLPPDDLPGLTFEEYLVMMGFEGVIDELLA